MLIERKQFDKGITIQCLLIIYHNERFSSNFGRPVISDREHHKCSNVGKKRTNIIQGFREVVTPRVSKGVKFQCSAIQ